MQRAFEIDGRTIDDASPGFVIAEIGANHLGKVELAIDLIRAAKEAGADAVKFQKRDNRSLFTDAMYSSPYAGPNSFGATYGEHREALELGREDYRQILAFARSLGITLLASAWDKPSVDLLEGLDVPAFKACSGDLTNIPLLRHMAATGKPVLLSTGGSEMEDIERAQVAIREINGNLALLQCTAAYPTPVEDLHLAVIPALRAAYPELVIGLSDHYTGTDMAPVAYALGARIIEKHFTLDRAWPGTDQAFSLLPEELAAMVEALDRTHKALGQGRKTCLPKEKKPMVKLRKKLVAARDLEAGHVLRTEDVAIKSPGDGVAPYRLEQFLGAKLLSPLAKDEALSPNTLSRQ